MARGRPRISPKVMERLMQLALEDITRPGEEILNTLISEFKESGLLIPALRTIQHYAKVFRGRATESKDDQPWALATMAKADIGIPWEAVDFLLGAFDELRHRQKEGKKLWHWSGHPFDFIYEGTVKSVTDAIASGKEPEHISVRPGTPRAPEGTVITNRQARWLWRIHIILPTLDLDELCRRADEYAYRELVAEYLGEAFDTSDLDESLINQLKPKTFIKKEKEKQTTEKGEKLL